ncbi:MAG TPA: hypothetical protein VJ739_19045, partial [Gemmataceae bacterium]|nr:hypothetical protein [Gemmataceae bacterium]
MKTRHWLFLLLAGLLGLPLPRARAQESAAPVTPEMRTRSHLPIPFSVGDPEEAQRLLARHLRRAEDLAGLQKMLQDPDFRRLAEDVARDPRKYGVEDQVRALRHDLQWQLRPDYKNPRWQKLVATVLERQARQPGADAEVSPEQREGWQGLLR